MRAFMSSTDKAIRNTFGESAVDRHGVMMAGYEALTILQEVEPDTYHTASFGIERLHGAGRADGQGRTATYQGCVALADALARFVALELGE